MANLGLPTPQSSGNHPYILPQTFRKKVTTNTNRNFFRINSKSLNDKILYPSYLVPLIIFSSCITRSVELFYVSTELFLPCKAPTIMLFYTSEVPEGDSRLIGPRGTLSQNPSGWRCIFLLQSKGSFILKRRRKRHRFLEDSQKIQFNVYIGQRERSKKK